jgi:hypothetical protein
MIDPQKHSLKSFVQRVLVFRLTVAGLVIFFIIGLSVFFVERNKVSEEVVDFRDTSGTPRLEVKTPRVNVN